MLVGDSGIVGPRDHHHRLPDGRRPTTTSTAATATTRSSAASAADYLNGGDGNDLMFGDFGRRRGRHRPCLVPLSRPLVAVRLDLARRRRRGARRRRPGAVRGPDGRRLGRRRADRRPGRGQDLGGRRRRRHDRRHPRWPAAWTAPIRSTPAPATTGWSATTRLIRRTGDGLSRAVPHAIGRRAAPIYDADGSPQLGRRHVAPTRTRRNVQRLVWLFDQSRTRHAGHLRRRCSSPAAPDDDVIFGQLGDDWIAGDGSVLDDARQPDRRPARHRAAPSRTWSAPAPTATTTSRATAATTPSSAASARTT